MPRVKYMDKYDYQRHHLWQYPNFHASGSIQGMKDKYYGKDALLVRSGSFIYKVPPKVYDLAH